jgi:sulfur-carrier protein adenylyltransferase/sulfurtransferase
MATASGSVATPSCRPREAGERRTVSGAGRYARHELLPEIGVAGQERLRSGRLLCVGAGGLGSGALPYLAGAGIGRITIIDPDRVDRTNLQRQVVFGERDVGAPKALAAAARLRDLNPDIEVVGIEGRFDASNAEALLRAHDVAVDGSDNYAAKYLLADTTAKLRMPLVYGSVTSMDAMVTVFDVRHGPCLRCLFPKPPSGWVPNCAEAGVLGPLVGMIGAVQAAEAVKLLVGGGGDGPLQTLTAACGTSTLATCAAARWPSRAATAAPVAPARPSRCPTMRRAATPRSASTPPPRAPWRAPSSSTSARQRSSTTATCRGP